jgi:hypothetical protein
MTFKWYAKMKVAKLDAFGEKVVSVFKRKAK